MLIAFLLLASLSEWIPARWQSADPATLALIRQTPVNCVLLEQQHWSPEFAERATADGMVVLGVVRPSAAPDAIGKAQAAGFSGIVLEGAFEATARTKLRAAARSAGLKVVELPERTSMDFTGAAPVVGTFQGVWPGVHLADDGSAKAAPTGAPWIDTNSGFLRFVRARTDATIWIGFLPPEDQIVKPARYLQAIGDAAMVGARWIVALDSDLNRRLLEGDEKAREAWKRIGAELEFWEQHRAGTLYKPCGQLALIQNTSSGGLLSNGIIDMLTARHTPLRTVPPPELSPEAVNGARILLDIDPPALSDGQRKIVKDFARGGGTLLSAPPGWEIHQQPGQAVVAKQDIQTLDNIWRGINMTIGRDNLGVRLFNVATMRSELVAAPGGEPVLLHLVNFSDYPAENITLRPLRKYSKATLYAPGAKPADLEIFENGEIDIELIESSAIVMLTGATGNAAGDEQHHRH